MRGKRNAAPLGQLALVFTTPEPAERGGDALAVAGDARDVVPSKDRRDRGSQRARPGSPRTSPPPLSLQIASACARRSSPRPPACRHVPAARTAAALLRDHLAQFDGPWLFPSKAPGLGSVTAAWSRDGSRPAAVASSAISSWRATSCRAWARQMVRSSSAELAQDVEEPSVVEDGALDPGG